MKALGVLGFLIAAAVALANGESSAASPKKDAAFEGEKAAILDVIEQQAAAFWAKDFHRWADTWVHAPSRFDMPGLSYETRILEKHNGKWKIAYLGYLLAGRPEAGGKR